MANPHLKIENRIKVCREYAELWQTYFSFFSEELEDKQITAEMETEFENIMNILALNQYKFSELCGDFMKDADAVLEILSETVSLRHLQQMPEATLSKLMVAWHTTFIDMNKALGRMVAKLTPKQLEALQNEENVA